MYIHTLTHTHTYIYACIKREVVECGAEVVRVSKRALAACNSSVALRQRLRNVLK
jgi:hypothetical protein